MAIATCVVFKRPVRI